MQALCLCLFTAKSKDSGGPYGGCHIFDEKSTPIIGCVGRFNWRPAPINGAHWSTFEIGPMRPLMSAKRQCSGFRSTHSFCSQQGLLLNFAFPFLLQIQLSAMGLKLSKPVGRGPGDDKNAANVIVDGGFLICPDDRILAHDRGEEQPSGDQGSNSAASAVEAPSSGTPLGGNLPPIRDYDIKLVAALIRARQIAPFYVKTRQAAEMIESEAQQRAAPAPDPGGGGGGGEAQQPPSSEQQPPPPSARVEGKKKKPWILRKLKIHIKAKPPKASEPQPEKAHPRIDLSTPAINSLWLCAKEVLVECPICCLAHPRNINWTACCRQPICTFCFVHLRMPPSGRALSCPFCNEAESFGVRYWAPVALEELPTTRTDSGESESIKESRQSSKSDEKERASAANIESVLRNPKSNPIEALASLVPASMLKKANPAAAAARRQRLASTYIYYYQQQQQQHQVDNHQDSDSSSRYHPRSQTLLANSSADQPATNSDLALMPFMAYYGSFV